MLNKVLTTRKYSSWDRCQGLGRGCNCAYGQARGLSNIWGVGLCQQMFLPYITSRLETVSRVDLVWDRYLTDILKQSTRDRRTHSGNTWLQERLFRRTGMLSWGVMLTKMNCFAICPIVYRLAKLAERWSSAQRMKRSSPHRMTWATSSISSHVPMRRQIRAFCSTLRIVHYKNFAKW